MDRYVESKFVLKAAENSSAYRKYSNMVEAIRTPRFVFVRTDCCNERNVSHAIHLCATVMSTSRARHFLHGQPRRRPWHLWDVVLSIPRST
jgi:hypothetical protein